MKKQILAALGLLLALSLAACGSAQVQEETEASVQLANPYVTCESAEDMQAQANLEVSLPAALPDWVTETIYRAMPGKLAEVIYKNDRNEIRVRIAQGDKDISGVYDQSHSTEKDVEVQDHMVHLKANALEDGSLLVFVSTWTYDGRTYSVTSTEGVPEETFLALLSEIR